MEGLKAAAADTQPTSPGRVWEWRFGEVNCWTKANTSARIRGGSMRDLALVVSRLPGNHFSPGIILCSERFLEDAQHNTPRRMAAVARRVVRV